MADMSGEQCALTQPSQKKILSLSRKKNIYHKIAIQLPKKGNNGYEIKHADEVRSGA
jgi:hypothetical protein